MRGKEACGIKFLQKKASASKEYSAADGMLRADWGTSETTEKESLRTLRDAIQSHVALGGTGPRSKGSYTPQSA